MKWYEIMKGAGFWCTLIGFGGIAGVIEFGTGLEASLIFLEIGSILLVISIDGIEKKIK